MLTLVTVIYGDARRYRVELFGSILSALKLRTDPDTRVVVYTDRTLGDFPLPVTERIISQRDWEDWTRGSGVTHLVKLHLIRQTLEEGHGPVLYFDTDTLFLVPPEHLAARLSPETALMHANEGPISDHGIWSDIAAWLGEGRKICGRMLSRHSVMYNSGIVGVVETHHDSLCRSVDIANVLYDVDPVFSLDQFSTGVALSGQAKIETCTQEVLHYWGWHRSFIRDAIDRFWQAHRHADIKELCADFAPSTYARPPQIRWQDKLYARCMGFRWRLSDDNRFACVALKSALHHANSDTETANRWFGVHIDFMRKPTSSREQITTLERACRTDHEACRTWLNTQNTVALEMWINDVRAAAL